MGMWNLGTFQKKNVLSGNYSSAHRTCYFHTENRDWANTQTMEGIQLWIWIFDTSYTESTTFQIKVLKCENNVLQYLLSTCDMQSSFLPGNPNSVMSPASSGQSEEQQYLEKLKQLSKYIEPLRRMINKIDKNEGEVSCIQCIYLSAPLSAEKNSILSFVVISLPGIKNVRAVLSCF